MKKWQHSLEKIVDTFIPYALAMLLLIIIIELLYRETAKQYSFLITMLDGFIVLIFFADLSFKYIRAKNIPYFLGHYWLDIMAVFPFFLVFRLFEEILLLTRFGEQFSSAQSIVHEVVTAERLGEEEARIVAEAEKTGKASRLRIISAYFKPLGRLPRMAKAISFFERPSGHHHPHEK